MHKKCTKCLITHPLTHFHKKWKWLQPICKDCNKIRVKERYEANKDYYKNKAKDYKKLLINTMRDKKLVPCTDCWITYPYYVMDYDHLENKLFNIWAVAQHTGMNKLLAEIAKCEVVCANCHRIRTFKRRISS